MDDAKLQEYLEFAKGLAQEAGEIMLRYFRSKDIGTTWKEDNSPVTVADTQINKLVIDKVQTSFPNHGIIGEEASYNPEKETVWVVDPIDGTAPYDLGMPCSTFCLALVYKGDVQVSIVLDPFSNRSFSAARGKGAFCNEEKIRIQSRGEIEQSYMFIPTGTKEEPHKYEQAITSFKKRGAKISFIPTFSYLATLVLESKALVCLMGYGSPWDAAAISLIAEEAGGRASDLRGNPRKYNEWSDGIIISNGAIHEEVVELINAHPRN